MLGSTGEPRSPTEVTGAAVRAPKTPPLRGAAAFVVLEVPNRPCRGLVVTEALLEAADPAAVDRGTTLGTLERVRAEARLGDVRTTGWRLVPNAPRAVGWAGASCSVACVFCCWACLTNWPMLVACPAATAMNAAPIMARVVAREIEWPRAWFRWVCCEDVVIERCLLRRARQTHCRIARSTGLLILGFPPTTSPNDRTR
jgi:hypothetical protein